MGVRVTISFDGIDTVISNLSTIKQKAEQGITSQVALLAKDTKSVWETATPVGKRKGAGRLRGDDRVPVSGMSFTLNNSVRYYKFVDEGHNTARGWRTKRGYRLAKRRSFVKGREMTEKATSFIQDNILIYLAKFLDGA